MSRLQRDGYPKFIEDTLQKLRILSAFGVTRWIPKWEGILKSWEFWVLLVQRKRANSIPISPQWWCGWSGKDRVCSDYKIRSHLCIVTRKVFTILNFSGYPLIWVSILLHQKHSKFSLFCGFRISIPSPWILWHLSREMNTCKRTQKYKHIRMRLKHVWMQLIDKRHSNAFQSFQARFERRLILFATCV